ncbi:MAG: divergent polysaccharide deacetylase family protein [Parvularculaceae bacterium]|nr:divergent polysaccharide deacetylase family protein [Parvularculaceae bacterium]
MGRDVNFGGDRPAPPASVPGREREKREGKRRRRPALRIPKIKTEILPPALSSLWPFRGEPMGARSAMLLAATMVIGIFAGTLAAVMSGGGSRLQAAHRYAAALDLRDAPIVPPSGGAGRRGAVIEAIISAGAPERFEPAPAPAATEPRVVIVFDDVGVDGAAFEALMTLPGPLTFSFLPYAKDVRGKAARASARGHDLLLHLPMEPMGGSDPGPGALRTSMDAGALFTALGHNLSQFDGYAGVNNHMGSKLTRDEQAMKRILAFLDQRGLFFLDSLTTGESKASLAGASVGAEVLVRDVFLDAEPGEDAVRRQLAFAERIAAETGYVIAIAHPRKDTLAVIGPWLTSAPARGFRIETITTLRAERAGAYAQNAADERLR